MQDPESAAPPMAPPLHYSPCGWPSPLPAEHLQDGLKHCFSSAVKIPCAARTIGYFTIDVRPADLADYLQVWHAKVDPLEPLRLAQE